MRNSLSIQTLMIFFLLFAQLGWVTHSITHVQAEHSQSSDQLPISDNDCDLCDVYEQIASTIGSSIVSFAPPKSFGHVEQNTTYSFPSIASAPFSARAPPYSA